MDFVRLVYSLNYLPFWAGFFIKVKPTPAATLERSQRFQATRQKF